MKMENTRSLEVLLRGLRSILGVMSARNPNRGSLQEALFLTEQTVNERLPAHERAALLRIALIHLRHADCDGESALERELLAAIRRTMTTVLFEYPSTPGHDRSGAFALSRSNAVGDGVEHSHRDH
jgi:hypothetical protein